MKKSIIAIIAAAMPAVMMAQGAVDLYQVSQTELRGTARFMSMAGAFGALGGDLSTMRQNPAGIGVYRRSEVGLTLDIDIQNSKFASPGESVMSRQTKVACDNFGYVGSVRLDNDVMPYFTWGASYGRAMSFNRTYKGRISGINNSLSNYIAANFADGYSMYELDGIILSPSGEPTDERYDPYFQGNVNAPWLGILGYQAFMANPESAGSSKYFGLFGDNSFGSSTVNVREKGYVDEYNISFGGNLMNTLYWGLSFGITDLSFTQETYYTEDLGNAYVVTKEDPYTPINGGAYNGLYNFYNVSGSGFNCKFGLIFKPVNELRLGFAVHTPTYYNLSYNVNAAADFAYWKGDAEQPYLTNMQGYAVKPETNEYLETGLGYYDRKMRTPWRMIFSAAGVVGGRAILSMDYEYEAYKDMRVSDEYGQFEDVTQDVKNYYRATNTIRVGAEYRITPQFSLRAGYSYKSSPAQESAYNNQQYIYTAGTNPMYIFDSSIQYVTCGLGYRTGGFSIDAAYVHKHRESAWSAFSVFDEWSVPSGKITDNNSHIVLSLGYKF